MRQPRQHVYDTRDAGHARAHLVDVWDHSAKALSGRSITRPPGKPYDHGLFTIVEEPWPADEEAEVAAPADATG